MDDRGDFFLGRQQLIHLRRLCHRLKGRYDIRIIGIVERFDHQQRTRGAQSDHLLLFPRHMASALRYCIRKLRFMQPMHGNGAVDVVQVGAHAGGRNTDGDALIKGHKAKYGIAAEGMAHGAKTRSLHKRQLLQHLQRSFMRMDAPSGKGPPRMSLIEVFGNLLLRGVLQYGAETRLVHRERYIAALG